MSAGAAETLLEAFTRVVVGPVVLREQVTGLGVHRRVPDVRARLVVDDELPRGSEPVLRGLPAEPGGNRRGRDATVGDDGLLRGAGVAREHPEVLRILEVERAKSIIVLKRSMRPGFAGVDNDLYYNEKCMMLFGDAKDSITKLISEMKSLL